MIYLHKAEIGTNSATEADAVCLPEFCTSLSIGGLNGYLMETCPDMLDGMMKYQEIIEIERPAFGDVVMTKSSGRYKVQFHCLTIETLNPEEQFNAVAQCVKACVEIASEMELKSIAMPAFGTGVIGTLTPEKSAEAILQGVAHANVSRDVPNIVIAVLGDSHYEKFSNVLDAHEIVNEAELEEVVRILQK